MESNREHKVDILVVDDVPDNVQLLARMLKRRGYIVATADNGFEALQKVKIVWPDLILLDVSMPKMDGFQVCKALKDDETTKDIPIIFLSAHSEQVDKLRGFQVGAVDYVAKPFHFHEVAARVAAHIELFRQRQENNRLREQEQIYFDKFNHLKNELIHTVTHNLKNPLTSIKLSLSLIQRILPTENPKANRYFENMENDLDRMLILISNLLDLSKIEMTATMKLRSVDLAKFLNDLLDESQYKLGKRHITSNLVAYTTEDITSIFDAKQVHQVLTKAIEERSSRIEDGGQLEICYWTVGDEVLVSISDQDSALNFQSTLNGESTHEEASEQDDDFDEHPERGLPIMQAIFERQGGRIWQDPASGDYRFTLPYVNLNEEQQPSELEKETKEMAAQFKKVMEPIS